MIEDVGVELDTNIAAPTSDSSDEFGFFSVGSTKPLVIASDPEMREELKGVLEGRGFEVAAVGSAAAARALFAAQRFDIVFLDVVLPDEWGLLLIDEIRQADPRAMVVALSRPGDIDATLVALRRGASDYIRPPFSDDALIMAVERCLCYRRLRAENHEQRTQFEQLLAQHLTERDELADRLSFAEAMVFTTTGLISEWKGAGQTGHLRRVSAICRAIAWALPFDARVRHDVDEEYIRHLGNAACVHDIGYVGIPDFVINKPGRLTEQELALVRRHPTMGTQVLRSLKGCFGPSGEQALDLAIEICSSHHERFDGTGYPYGLVGEDIPLSGRITAIADVYDAATSSRPYRADKMTHHQVRDIVQEGSGSAFDPVIVEAFMKVEDEVQAIKERFPD